MTIARPTSTPAAYATNGGTRTEPGSGEKATGRASGARMPARVFNWLVGVPLDWVAWLAALFGTDEELTYQTPKARNVHLAITDYVVPYNASPPDVRYDIAGGDHQLLVESNSAVIVFPLQKYLRNGMVLTGMGVTVIPGIARATVGNRITVSLRKKAHNYLLPGSEGLTDVEIAAAHDDGTTAQQRIAITGLTETIDRLGYEYSLRVTFGNDAGTHLDALLAVLQQWNDIGPRNA